MADAATITTHGASLPVLAEPSGQSTRRAFLTAAAVLAPAIALAAPIPAAADVDAAIFGAWQRYVAAHAMIEKDGRNADSYWGIVDEAHKLIQSTTAQTPRGIEVQVWTALHTSGAFLADDDAAVLRMDAGYLQQNHRNFDWKVLPLLAAIQSLRSMGDKA